MEKKSRKKLTLWISGPADPVPAPAEAYPADEDRPGSVFESLSPEEEDTPETWNTADRFELSPPLAGRVR